MTRYRCRWLVTMDGEPLENGAFVVDQNHFVDAGPASQLLEKYSGEFIDLGECIVLPGLINAHCHLDYSSFRGSILPSRNFPQWISRINALKRSLSDDDYLKAMDLGFAELRRSGVTSVFNIVATPQILPRLAPPRIRTWFFLELIDIRPRPWIDESAFGSWLFFEPSDWLGGFGLSPHAPYTASAELYSEALAAAHNFKLPFTTHLSESASEYEMFAAGKGDLFEAKAKELYTRANRRNLYIKIPGTREGLPAIEEAIFAGVPVNITLLFSPEHYVAAAEAYLRGIERRVAAGLRPDVSSVASLFISRWDSAVIEKVPEALNNRLGIAIGKCAYKAYWTLMGSWRWQRVFNAGARPQRLLFASTGTKDPKASDVLYIKALAAPLTVKTVPEGTLKAFADHGEVNGILPADGGDCEAVFGEFARAGVDINALATKLQDEGAASFVKSWNELMEVIVSKSAALQNAASR
jgi:transaldolase